MNQTAGSDQAAVAPRPASASRRRSWSDLAVFSQGFRPFFLLAGIWAIIALNLWIHAYAGLIDLPTRFDALTWHSHEMLFGYAAAVLAGFLLTAIPNWTGRLPLQGRPLAALVLFWIIGRLAVGFSTALPPVLVAVLDLAFLKVLLLFVLREILAGKNWRNLPLPAALIVLILASALVHAGQAGWIADADIYGTRLALAVFAVMITLIGGRVVPSFTRNWLAKAKITTLPAPFGPFDKLALLVAVIALLGWTLAPESRPVGYLCLLAAAIHALRLTRWQGHRTGREPLLLVLHLGYGWIPVSLALLGTTALAPAYLPASVGIHALTAGAIATMTLAVMTRAIRGHTGRELTSDLFNTLVFVIITFAALTRLVAPYLADHYMNALMVSAALWELAFLGFVVLNMRALVTRR